MMKNKYIKKLGFTVLETIISIAVVGLGIAGATIAVKTGLSASITAKEQVKAFYLAQEAIEIIRNTRDANMLAFANGSAVNWLQGLASSVSDPCYFGSTCYVSVPASGNPPTFTRCSGSWGSCPPLRQNGSSGNDAYLYGYNSSWSVTKYTREIQLEQINANEISVTIRILWPQGSEVREFKTKTILTNWI